jgi:hypothetical protein
MQNYKNHLRFYPAHHFIFYPVLSLLFALAVKESVSDELNRKIWIFGAAIVFLIGWLSFMLRQHYGMTLQNRIVVLEMRYRFHVLTSQRFEAIEHQLSFGQIAALRFASDAELPGLVNRTLAEKLSPDAIKKAIVNWLPDHRRI